MMSVGLETKFVVNVRLGYRGPPLDLVGTHSLFKCYGIVSQNNYENQEQFMRRVNNKFITYFNHTS